MRKDYAESIWKSYLGLVSFGSADHTLKNPAIDFTRDAKAGKYDHLTDEAYEDLLNNVDELANGIWQGAADLTAGELLLAAFEKTNIPTDTLNNIADILSECSANTNYLDTPKRDVARSALSHAKQPVQNNETESVHIPLNANAMSPKEIEEYLHNEGGIIGQNDAVRAASMIMFSHREGRPSVSLFVGMTGSVKTQIWRALQKMYGDDRIVIHDASSLSPEGAWRGGNKLSTLLKVVPAERRDHIILVLDEFDKMLSQPKGSNADFSDLLQNQFLKLCDHDKIFFGDENGKDKGFFVDASGISVVFLGAFQRLLEKKTKSTGSIGFGADMKKVCDYSNTEITTEDLVAYGMRDELAGRITRITSLEPLTADDMARIGRNEIKRIEDQTVRDIAVDDETLLILSHEAVEKKLGARWLKNKLTAMIDDLIYEDPYGERYYIQYEPTDADEPYETQAAIG